MKSIRVLDKNYQEIHARPTHLTDGAFNSQSLYLRIEVEVMS